MTHTAASSKAFVLFSDPYAFALLVYWTGHVKRLSVSLQFVHSVCRDVFLVKISKIGFSTGEMFSSISVWCTSFVVQGWCSWAAVVVCRCWALCVGTGSLFMGAGLLSVGSMPCSHAIYIIRGWGLLFVGMGDGCGWWPWAMVMTRWWWWLSKGGGEVMVGERHWWWCTSSCYLHIWIMGSCPKSILYQNGHFATGQIA